MTLKRTRWSTAASFALFGALLGTWSSRLPYVKAQLHLMTGELSIALLGLPVGLVVATLLARRIIERTGMRRTFVGSQIAVSGALMLPTLATGALTLGLALAGFGLAAGLYDVAINTQAVRVERAYGRSVLAQMHGFFSVGVLAAAPISSLAVSSGVPMRLQFAVIAGAVLIAGLILRGDPGEVRSPALVPAQPPARATLTSARLLGVVAFCGLFVEGAVEGWGGIHLRESQGASLSLAALSVAAFAAGMSLGRFLGDWLVDRFGRVRLCRCSSAIAAGAMVFAVTTPDAPAALASYVLVGAGTATIFPIAISAAGEASGASVSPIATITRLAYLGLFLAPAAVGLIGQLWDLSLGLLVVAAALGVCALVIGQAIRPPGYGQASLPPA